MEVSAEEIGQLPVELSQLLGVTGLLPGMDGGLEEIVVFVLLIGLEFKVEVVAEQGEEVYYGFWVHFAAAIDLDLP